MKKIVLTFGLISGCVVSAMMILTMSLAERIGFDSGMVIGYASMLAAFLLIYFGVRSYRDNVRGGSIGFGRAVAVGAQIFVISALMYTATWEVIYFGFKSDFLTQYQAYEMQKERNNGATPAQLEAKATELKRAAELYQNPAYNAAITFCEPLPVGIIVVLISAGLLSRKRKTTAGSAEVLLGSGQGPMPRVVTRTE